MLHRPVIQRPALAFDRASVRSFDADGRMHLVTVNVSRACVNEYLGAEIPDFETLGLDPAKLYRLYRDPSELSKAARTFNNLPVLSRHVPVDVADHRPDLVCGSTGTDARFVAPFLQNSMVIWTSAAIEGVESGRQRELSAAYRYRPVMEPGTADGERFDGRMTEIIGNHVALVPEGRCGPSVVVADQARARLSDFATRHPNAARIKVHA